MLKNFKEKESVSAEVVHWPRSATVSVIAERRLHLRLSVEDLHCGGLVSSREGNQYRLWAIETVSAGAGDGYIELRLKPKDLLAD